MSDWQTERDAFPNAAKPASREDTHANSTDAGSSSAPSKDDLDIPKIELPKGGGALKSIDEKFRVNAANGTASLAISLPTSKTRSGFSPALSLSYNSGAGNGIFGLGWSLSQESIRRTTEKRLPEYEDSRESDVFLLSDAEDMVPVLVSDGAGNWLPDEFVVSTGETVRRYRPRIEGAFARIERITPPGAATFYWKIASRDNVATIYGRSAAARLEDPSSPNRIFKWLPELSYDDKGNCIEFSYVPEDLVGVPNTLPESNRFNGNAPFANTLLKRVAYGNTAPYYPDPKLPYSPTAPGDPGYLFQLVLDYGDHDAANPTLEPQRAWPCRLDAFSEYKPGFEVRTYRLCRRALLFHVFKELNDGVAAAPCLVRSLDLDYRYFQNPAVNVAELRNLEVDYPIAIRQSGWVKTGPGSYSTVSLPPVELTYQELAWDRSVHSVGTDDLANAPVGLSRGYQFVDLWSEGISGIFTEQGSSWFYKSNLGGGQFTPAQVVSPKPSFTGIAAGTVQLQDLEGDGRKFVVVSQAALRGSFVLSDEGNWGPFVAADFVPNVSVKDPFVRFIDLDGDGRLDLAVSEENVFLWYPSAGTAGYESPRMAPKPFDEERGPALVFSDVTGSIFLANMTGSGLTDIVRVRNGEVCYWPNLGYGRFGAKVAMDFSPIFDAPDLFHPAYIHLADVSGTGATDILYLGKEKASAWLNRSGNSWSEETDVDPFPSTEVPNELSVVDLLGNGTACLVWSSPLPRYTSTPMQYVDLMGGKKPYLLSGYKTHAGKEVSVEFASSTSFYLADKLAGKPWITKLPFPVHCVTNVTSRDTVTRAYLTTEYTYHHGYYDHAEREYRGFGRVEQTDTETFDRFVLTGASNIVDQPLHQAPVLTKTWFHTGAFFGDDDILALFRSEYFQNADFVESHLPAPGVPPGLSSQERREAQRACKGTTIRQEIYGVDGIMGVSSVPYSSTERNCLVQRVQPLGANRYASFLVTENEVIAYNYERNAKDPRIVHTLNAAIDQYGNLLEVASVAYPRQPGAVGLPAPVQAEQQKLLVTYAVSGYTNDAIDSASYRLRRSCESTSFELTGSTPTALFFSLAEVQSAFVVSKDIPYEDSPDGSQQKRALKHSRTLFFPDDLGAPLPLAQMQSLGIACESYRLTFTSTLRASIYGPRVTPAFLAEGRYAHSNDLKAAGLFPASDDDDQWWSHAGRAGYPGNAANAFYMPDKFTDPFGNATLVAYDTSYQLLVRQVTDPVGNITTVQAFDFRHLKALLVKDANANLSEVRFDALGFVVGSALQGKGGEADDLTAFVPDLSSAQVAAFFGDPVGNGPALLQRATSRFVYDLSVVPVRVAIITRETHAQAALASGVSSKLRYSVEYSDGFGNLAMRKLQTAPGIALALDGANHVIQVDTTPNLRWIGTGRTVLNNKGKPVKQYEPYFSATFAYEDDPQFVETGVSPLLFYDPVGRNVRTEYPDGTFSTIDLRSWLTVSFDRNDTVLDSAWYATRTIGSLASNPRENQAASKTALHAKTPQVTHADGLGRSFYAVSQNNFIDHGTALLKQEFYETCTYLDIEGKTREVVDPRGNAIVSYEYEMLGNQAYMHSADAGERWILADCKGAPLYTFDSKKQIFHTVYDAARRPTQKTVAQGPSTILYEQITYGEGQPGDQASNLRGRTFEQRDQVGVATNRTFDFKGNPLEIARALTVGYQDDIDWNLPQALQLEVFVTQSEYDALSRPIRTVEPHVDPATANVVARSYDESGLLHAVAVNLGGAALATTFVKSIDRNEKGQRSRIDRGNGTSTLYKYDPDTFRMIGLVTTRDVDPEQFWADPTKVGNPAFADDVLQFLTYTFDPVGNVTYVKDDAQETVFFDNALVEPSNDYTYDSIYRLTQSIGREQIAGKVAPDPSDSARSAISLPAHSNQLRSCTLQYDYDSAGNMLAMKNVGSWSTAFTYGSATNQLLHAVNGGAAGTPFTYPYDLHGNLVAMPHLTALDWDFADRLRHTSVSAGAVVSQQSWYVYDSAGQRVRKVVKKGNVIEERVYLGHIEVFRRSRAGTPELERETLHVADDKDRIAMVDRLSLKPRASMETTLSRYQYANNLGSACLELDNVANVISYEEYYAFGSTSFQGTDQSREVPTKRYRYTGKERDEETGLYYHGARYYAPWLARWTAADPIGIKAGPNVYSYVTNNPVVLHDPQGTEGEAPGKKDEGAHTGHGGAPPPASHHKDPKGAQHKEAATADKKPAPSKPPSLADLPWRPHITRVPELHLDRLVTQPRPTLLTGPLPASAVLGPPEHVFPSFTPPWPTPPPEAEDSAPPPLLREDAQAIVFGGYDPGSHGGVVIANLALTLPHVSLTRPIAGDDFWGKNRVGVNVLSGVGPVLQYQRIEGARTPGATDDPVYRSQTSFGLGVNVVDLQIRRNTGVGGDGAPKFDAALIDIQLPIVVAHQFLTDPLGGTPGSSSAREANQFGFGVNVDVHITPHVSIFGQTGGQYSNFGGLGFSPTTFGIGLHSEAQ